jgi:tetratricopeptide (TPR) repeat protein
VLPLAYTLTQVIAISMIAWQSSARSGDSATIAALKLYRLAAQQLVSDDPLQAIEPLQVLVNDHPSFALTPLAALRLAECHLAQQRPREALKLLLEWHTKLTDAAPSNATSRSDPECGQRTLQLVQKALTELAAADIEFLEQCLASQSSLVEALSAEALAQDPVSKAVITELAQRYCLNKNFSRSLELLLQLGGQIGPAEQKLRDFDLPLALIGRAKSKAELQSLQHSLSPNWNNTSWNLAERCTLQLALSDAWLQQSEYTVSLQLLQQLADYLDASLAANSHLNSDAGQEVIQWRATIDLRRGELMLLNKQYGAALELASESLQRYVDYSQRDKFQLLAARCSIADIQFDSARQQLQQLIESPQVSVGSRAQAFWMLGEIEFLLHHHAAAIEHYSRTIEMIQPSIWQPRALLQSAKCYELLGKPLAAMAAYQRIIDHWPDSDSFDFAKRRLNQMALKSSPQSAAASSASDNPVPSFIQR